MKVKSISIKVKASDQRMHYRSPYGWIEVKANPRAVTSVSFVTAKKKAAHKPNIALRKAERALDRYFSGSGKIGSLPMQVQGTEFEKKVWNRLRKIPYGQTVSYSSLARVIGFPGADRAVGNAVGKNPISILIPCHRVIRRSGALGHYAWGVRKKKLLIEGEKMHASMVKYRPSSEE